MRRSIWTVRRVLPLLCLFALLGRVAPANAQVGSDRYASVVMDARSGDLLSASAADELRYPASLTKMMTIYMLFEALRDRRVSLNQLVPVSAHAAAMMPSKLGLVPGTVITVEQALLGLVTKSANDAAAALGELLGGDEERFAQMMTMRARALGMSHSTFRNASGWPDPDQVSTARDLAVLARHLVQDFPVEYRYFSTPSFVFHGRMIPNHDRMLQTYPGADGLKTGYTEASGCNLVTSALRGDVRLIGVVLGTSNGVERDSNMASLLDAGFDRMGVPVSPMEYPRTRFPALVAAASAATLPPSTIQPRHPVAGFAASRTGRVHPVWDDAPLRSARQELRIRPPRESAAVRVLPHRSDARDRHLAESAARLRPSQQPAVSRPLTRPAGARSTAVTPGSWTRSHG